MLKLSSTFDAISQTVCHVQIVQNKKETIVITTELPINQGMSITNAAEFIVEKIVSEFHLDPLKTRFIEHWGDDVNSLAPNSYDTITFAWHDKTAGSPKWKRVGSKEIEGILGRVIKGKGTNNSSKAN